MKTITKKITALCAMAVVALMLPVAALADINAYAVLSVGQSISLDTGATNTSGTGDITFTGTSITYIGNAKGGSLALLGSGQATFNSLTQAELTALASLATATPIPASSIPRIWGCCTRARSRPARRGRATTRSAAIRNRTPARASS